MRLNRFNRLRCHNRPRLRLTAALLCGALLLLQCSRSDVITGAGASVVSDIDPALIDHSRGFVTITLDGMTAATDSFSLPATPDPLFGTSYATNSAPIGISKDGDTLAAHVQYTVTGGAPYTMGAAAAPAPYSVKLDSVFICFQAVDNASSGITLFRSNTLPELAPVNRADTTHYVAACDTCEQDNKIGSFDLSAPDSTAQIALPPDLAKKIFNRRMTTDSTSSEPVAFSIVDYNDSLMWIRNPYILVRVYVFQRNIDDSALVLDTLTGLTRYTAFENAEAAKKRALLPYSSQFTRRTAVFKIDMGKIADTLASLGLSGNKSELLNAVTAVWHERERAPGDSGSIGLKTRNAGNYKAAILDNLIERETILNADSTVSSRPLYDEFAKIGSTALRSEYFNTHSFKTVLRGVLEKYNDGTAAKPYIYVYLRPVPAAENGSGSAILWRKPLKIEAVFTPSRAQ